MREHGAQGFSPQIFEAPEETLGEDDIDEYGIDWDAYNDWGIQEHHHQYNPIDHLADNPFIAHWPEQLNEIIVEEPNCPFNTTAQLKVFQQSLTNLPVNLRLSRNMEDHKLLWIEGMRLCMQIVQEIV
jgi:hypothetical protein